MDGWMDGYEWVGEWMDGCAAIMHLYGDFFALYKFNNQSINQWLVGWMDGCIMDGCGWVCGWMDRWMVDMMDGWVYDGWMGV
jgi:hypothetical protein